MHENARIMCTCELQSCSVVLGASLMLGHHCQIPNSGDAVAHARRKVLVENGQNTPVSDFEK